VTFHRVIPALCAAAASLACALVPGEGRFVHIDTEEALIIWDEAAQRQHFIRRALVETDAKDFGFLVPTPGKPELAEVDGRAFEELAEITTLAARTAPVAITVLEQKIVAGYDAAVLEAADAGALDGWLKAHGYPSSPELMEWLKPYIAHKWKITAFKVAAGTSKVATGAVRMSFQTPRPFFPYREPVAAGKARERLLRVYFLADARFRGVIGDYEPWPGVVVWSNTIDQAALAQLLKEARLPPLAGGGGRRLTEFEDRSSPRPVGGELFFERAADQSTLARSPGYRYAGTSGTIIAFLAFAILAIIGGIWFFMRRIRG
jgi:hypothetical protein